MDTLLIFFAFPIAVIIISAILEKILKSPIAVAAFIFAVFLVVTFAAFDETFLIATLVYTIIAFITALIVHYLKQRNENNQNLCNLLAEFIQNNNSNNQNNNESICDTVEDLLSSNNVNTVNNTNTTSNNCGCRRFRRW